MRVGFLGKMGTGKTTAAKLLYTAMGFEKVSLAGPLKQIAELRNANAGERYSELYRWAFELLPDPLYQAAVFDYVHPRTGLTISTPAVAMLVQLWSEDLEEAEDIRELYQRIGTDSGRFIKPSIWIDHFARNLQGGPSVVDDIRFLNEGEALAKLGFLKVKVTCPEDVRQARLTDRDGSFNENRQGHASETELDEIVPDVLIHNIADTKYLYTAVNDALHKFRHGEYVVGQGEVQGPVQYAPTPEVPTAKVPA